VTAAGRRLRRGYRVWGVVGPIAKEELYGFLGLKEPVTDETPPPPGYVHFPEYGEDYFKQLTAEQLVSRKTRGGFVTFDWEMIPGRENHALDARVYARAAAWAAGLDRFQESDWRALEQAIGQTEPVLAAAPALASNAAAAPAPTASPARPTGWLGPREGWLRR